MFGYTDYPFNGMPRGTQKCEVLAYDRDKYVEVRLPSGIVEMVKRFYVYKDEARTKWFHPIELFTLPWNAVGYPGKRYTKQQATEEWKRKYKRKTRYLVDGRDESQAMLTDGLWVRSLDRALKQAAAFLQIGVDANVYWDVSNSYFSETYLALSIDRTSWEQGRTRKRCRPLIKRRHIRKYFGFLKA